MKDSRTLYFLHIPKCGGMDVNKHIFYPAQVYGIPFYPSPDYVGPVDLNNFAYIAKHLGTYPIGKIQNLDIACLFRDPVDRSISNFAWLFMTNRITTDSEYNSFTNIKDMLTHYLFNDIKYFTHRNLQCRFICNEMSELVYRHELNKEDLTKKELEKFNKEKERLMQKNPVERWFLDDENSSVDFAKSQIDSFDIIDTINHHDRFVSKIYKWFEENYSIDLGKYQNSYSGIFNESLVSFDGNQYKTPDLKSMLSQEELDQILENNLMDKEIFDYVSEKVSGEENVVF